MQLALSKQTFLNDPMQAGVALIVWCLFCVREYLVFAAIGANVPGSGIRDARSLQVESSAESVALRYRWRELQAWSSSVLHHTMSLRLKLYHNKRGN